MGGGASVDVCAWVHILGVYMHAQECVRACVCLGVLINIAFCEKRKNVNFMCLCAHACACGFIVSIV